MQLATMKPLKKKASLSLPGLSWRELGCLFLLMSSASCVPFASATPKSQALLAAALIESGGAAAAQTEIAAATPPAPEPMLLAPVSPTDAEAINAAIPIVGGATSRPSSMVFRAQSPWDQQRSLQCLAEAIFYEARSESDDGQRAVAQVVLNRVRHPAFPKSVCGVVYQGPNRAGGGCQFTFTCDGSLSRFPGGFAWERARRIAAEALAGSVYAPVGYATNYHTQEVVPVWAYRLVKLAVIGAHSFYRLPGGWGDPGAFRATYAGREPAPAALIAARLPSGPIGTQQPLLSTQPFNIPVQSIYAAAASPGPKLRAPRLSSSDQLPDSQVRDEYRTSGQWLDGGTTVTR
jgi:spore germination cell wall hydrolase CwlJ-like protein